MLDNYASLFFGKGKPVCYRGTRSPEITYYAKQIGLEPRYKHVENLDVLSVMSPLQCQ